MLQRNPHPYALDVPAVPATVQPGETVDWPDLIAGFEPVPDGPSLEPAATPEAPAKTPKTPAKRTADPADTQEA